MDNKEIEKIGNIVSDTVKVVLKSRTQEEQNALNVEAEYDTIVSHGKKYVELDAHSVITVIDELNKVFHPTTHDFLSCPVCRPLFESKINAMGYDIVIKKKPQTMDAKQKARKSNRINYKK